MAYSVVCKITDENDNQIEKYNWVLDWDDAVCAFVLFEIHASKNSSLTTHTYECNTYDWENKLMTELWYKEDAYDVGTWMISDMASHFRLACIDLQKRIEDDTRKLKDWKVLVAYFNEKTNEMIGECA